MSAAQRANARVAARDAPPVEPDPNIVVFDYGRWMACFPEFAAVTKPRAEMFFTVASQLCDNTACSPVPAQQPRSTILDLLTAHVAALNGGLTACGVIAGGQGQAPVGRIASATEGSVSVSFDFGSGGGDGPGAAWYNQTQYGALYWAMTAQFRTWRYYVGPQPFSEANVNEGRLGAWRRW